MADIKKPGTRSASPATKEPAVKKKFTVKDVDPSQMITVRNGYQGVLTYKSARTGETYKWDHFGDEQEIELRELRNAKSSAKRFFEDNWFLFDDEFSWVPEYLGVGNMYKNAIGFEDFSTLFSKTPAEISEIIKGLSSGQKSAVACKARQLIEAEEIDSLKVISALEKLLGTQLIEK